MDLASLSLGQIASMLSPKQQEVLLASISVAANFIQQIQHEEQEREVMMQQLNYSDDLAQHSGGVGGSSASVNTDNGHQLDDDDEDDDDEDFDDDDDYDTDNNLTDLTLNNNASSKINNTLPQQQRQQQRPQIHHQFHSDRKPSRRQQQQAQSIHSHTHSTNDTQNLTQSNRNNATNNITSNNSNNNNNGNTTESEADPSDLLTIRLFAEELKSRRKLIRLSQKGAAQSLRAFTGGAQPCTDAIIYHFENLQLEPERAMQLIPLLKDWLDWAEKHRLNGKQLPMMNAVTKVPRERKRKVVLFNEKAKHYLEDAFAKNNHPDRYQLDVISEELNIPTRSIRKWFTNRRQRKRFAEKFLAAGNTSSTSI